MEINFNIFSIKANGVENAAALNVGTNILVGFHSSAKSMMGTGQVRGDQGRVRTELSSVDDRDCFDTPYWEVSSAGEPGS